MDADLLDSSLAPTVPVPLAEAWGDIVDRTEFLRDDPSFIFSGGTSAITATSVSDRSEGRFRPIYETEQDLSFIRALARNLMLFSGVRTGALETLANYTLGSGFKFRAAPRNDQDPTAVQLASVIQARVDQFIDENDFNGVIDREAHLRSREDGEALLAFDDESIREGKLLLQFIEPDQLVEPADARQLEEFFEIGAGYPLCWKFGVCTPENRTWKSLGYHIVRDGSGRDWDYVDAKRLEHIKRNVTRNAKRGVSDFIEVIRDLMNEAKLNVNMTLGAALQAAIAWIRQGAKGQTQTQMRNVNDPGDLSSYSRAAINPGGTPKQQKIANYGPGTILNIGDGQEYQPGPMGAERNAGFEIVGQYALRRIGVRWSMPEYMISGDASNNNRASSETAESPFVKARESDQQFYLRHFLSLNWKAIRILTESGRLEKYGIGRDEFDRVRELVKLTAGCPNVASREILQAAQADKILVDGGILSKVTWAARNELDYEEEQKLGAKEAAPPPVMGVPGLPPKRIGGPVANGALQDQPQDAEYQAVDPTRKAAVSAALESISTTAEARAVLNQLAEVYP